MSLPDFMLDGGPAPAETPVSESHPASISDENPTPPPFVEGVFREMPAAQYFAVEAMSQSGAKAMLRSPMHFRYERENPRPPTAAMRLGTAVHAGILEPETFEKTVAIAPDVDARTKEGRAIRDAFLAAAAGKIVLSREDFDRARRCVDAVYRHPSARYLLEGSEREISLFWRDGRYKVACKARLDARNHGGIIDLKTTQDASADDFSRTIANFGYHVQGAHYFSGCEHLFDETPAFFVDIAVETEAPYGVACHALPGNAIMAGAARMNEALRRYSECLASGFWPGYPETVETITLPRWATRADF